MKNIRTSLYLSFTAILLLSTSNGCKQEQTAVDTNCASDADCPNGLSCDTNLTVPACKCSTNDACKLAYPTANMYCNSFGDCQERPDCIDNNDCDEGTYCNSLSGTCISQANCTMSIHCPLGQVCDRATSTCKAGCSDTGDCQLGYICVNKQCMAGNCTYCEDNLHCEFGDVCNKVTGQCQAVPGNLSDFLCATCTGNDCPQGLICLIDDTLGGDAQYCTYTGCNADSECPSGYPSCGNVSLVDPNWACTSNTQCTNGAPCVGSSEGATAYCACLRNEDCAVGGMPMSGTCTSGSCSNVPAFNCSNDSDCAVVCKPNPADINEANGWPASTGRCATTQGVCGKGQGALCSNLSRPMQSPCHDY